MRLSDFDYDLPESAIALRPAFPRSAARLLQILPENAKQQTSAKTPSPPFSDHLVGDLPKLLRPNDVLVVNDTKVIPARLTGERRRGDAVARIEATLIEQIATNAWRALAKPGKRLRVGDRISFLSAVSTAEQSPPSKQEAALIAEVAAKEEEGGVTLLFDQAGAALDAAIAVLGAPPLPPYIAARRKADARDVDDYQTIFAERAGAVAAPTAALHFDAPLLAALDRAGVPRVAVTLHVGAGTFLPVKADDPRAHKMHAERGEIDAEAVERIQQAKAAGGRVVAVGTTALRVLETAASDDDALGAASLRPASLRPTLLRPWCGETDLFITPGFRFRVADGLLTNFHLPRSTLLMLVAAFAGRKRILDAYRYAVANSYRFYSYGDATLLWR